MKILNAYEVTATVIETDHTEWPIFKRYSADNWENLMGMSWETVCFEEDELEAMYQDWLNKNSESREEITELTHKE